MFYGLIIWLLFFLAAPLALAVEADEPDLDTPAAAVAVEDEAARQLRIYKDALLQGTSESIRIDAAVGLLIRKDAPSRQVLLDTLATKDNLPAATAVCKALIKSRGLGTVVAAQDEFLAPLMGLLQSDNVPLAKLAAEALLVYRFEQLNPTLATLVKTPLPNNKQTRINGIYALQLRPEPEALQDLIGLMNDSDPEIVRASELALQESFGIPIGTGKQVWADILGQLQQKNPTDIRRERLLRQEMKLREAQAERDLWKKLYLSALDKEFELADAPTRSGIILDRLGSELPAIRLWSLEKLQRYPAESALPLREKLLGLLADENRQVRLMTAKVLTTMSVLNPAEKLLERYNLETDTQTALAMFEALGEACFFAFSPGSKISLPEQIKLQTIEIAILYAAKDDPEMARKGAEVIRKLLEINGLSQNQAEKYLQVILDRYQVETQNNGPIRADLLSIMARLCGQGTSKVLAGRLYTKAFLDVLRAEGENSQVRLSAASGLVNIDKPMAMRVFREQKIIEDPSLAVKLVVIELAGQMGTVEDIEWLSVQLATNGPSEPAWGAIKSILQRQDAQLILDYAKRLETSSGTNQQVLELLELVEQKAQAQKQQSLLEQIHIRLIKAYSAGADYEQVLECFGKLQAESQKDPAKNAQQVILPVFQAYLQTAQPAKAAGLIKSGLDNQRLTSQSELLTQIEDYFDSAQVQVSSKSALYQALRAAIQAESSPDWWKEKMNRWESKIETKDVPSVPAPAGSDATQVNSGGPELKR